MSDTAGNAISEHYVPELGQMAFGTQAYSAYDLPEYVGALMGELLDEMGRVYWNIKQEEWEHYDPYDLDLPGVTYSCYYWGDCTCGFDALDERWSDEHKHAPQCFHTRYNVEGDRLHETLDWTAAHEQLTEWAKANGYTDAPNGMSVYCDCGHNEEYVRWRKDHHHAADCPVLRPNLAFDGVEICWYKHPGRGMSSNVSWSPEQWVAWFDRFLAVIRAKDDAHRRGESDGRVS